MNILIVEYPGYSIYDYELTTSAKLILDDIPFVMKYLFKAGY